jgi:hypothetical protein
VALVYWLRIVGLDTSLGASSEDLLKEPALLDSFAEPSVACALLKQEADRLLLLYNEARDRETPLRLVEAASRFAKPNRRTVATALANLPVLPSPETQSLLSLDTEVRDLRLDLSRKVLTVYLDQHLWSRFVDRYLEIVLENPDCWEVKAYFTTALDCAQKCGRTAEVCTALWGAIEAHPESRGLLKLRGALATWKAEHPQDARIAKG